jgi:hypothetical protein
LESARSSGNLNASKHANRPADRQWFSRQAHPKLAQSFLSISTHCAQQNPAQQTNRTATFPSRNFGFISFSFAIRFPSCPRVHLAIAFVLRFEQLEELGSFRKQTFRIIIVRAISHSASVLLRLDSFAFLAQQLLTFLQTLIAEIRIESESLLVLVAAAAQSIVDDCVNVHSSQQAEHAHDDREVQVEL